MSELFPGESLLVQAIGGGIATLVLASAIAVITRRSPVAAVAWLVVHFVSTACLYVLLHSQFVAAIQVLVYAGAILVLFLFVIMLLRVDQQPEAMEGSGIGRKGLVILLGVGLLAVFARVAFVGGGPGESTRRGPNIDTVEWLSTVLFTEHAIAFEASSVVLLAAMAGALVLATRRVRRGSVREVSS